MHRVQLHVVEGVVHPAEVPLEPETQPAGGGRTGNAGKIGRLFRHRHRARRLFAQHAVGITQKLNRFKVFPTAELVRHPLALFAAVVAINHRRHRIDPQRVNAKALDPVQRIADQVVADLATAIVVDQGIPVLVIAFARVAVFIQRGAVKRGEGKIIRREMTGHPVQNDVKPRGVRGVDKVAEILPGAEATGGRVQPGWLIAPAAVKRMLVNRQQFEVGKAHPFGIRDQLVGKLAVA